MGMGQSLGREPFLESRGFALAMLAGVMFFQQADTIMFSMATEPIGTELHLTDLQMGLLNGTAFALFYGCAAIPLARISDRAQRRNVIAGCLALWSLFTALTALATGFTSLFAARLLVGIGEAGAGPAAMALIAARYPAGRRASAMALLHSGRYVGLIAGLWGAGEAITHIGWRHTFLLFGVPGMLLAVALLVTVREPRDIRHAEPTRMIDALRGLNQPVIHHLFGLLASAGLVACGMLAWAPAYYHRAFGMSSGEVGFWLGLALGVGTLIGALLGGFIAGRLPVDRPVLGLKLAFWSLLVNAPLAVLPFAVQDKTLSLAAMMAATIAGAICVGPVYGALQSLTEARVRATAIALFAVGTVLVGQGIGPLLVGAISDLVRTIAGDGSLRWSLIFVTMLGFWTVYHAWRVVQLYPTARIPEEEPSAA